MLIERDLRALVGADARRVARTALAEDGERDITTEVSVTADQVATGVLEFRTGGVVAGMPYADAVASACDLPPVTWYHASGAVVPAGSTLGLLRGDLGRILRAERVILNLLQRATGIANLTRRYVDAVRGTHTRILHTRKTAPGLRLLDVTSVIAGGGHLHRLGLATTVMVKDNHWRALERGGRTLAQALQQARASEVVDCFVEVESRAQLEEACAAGATRLLVDNQAPATVLEWGRLARSLAPGIEIEATGGITLENIRAFAEAEADYISIGALTHSVIAADVSLEIGR
ncbi:MAG: carboxylating nicotinate-nucleotide diphosphorylase [Gemmatimonadetes bacterium]|nr:carboxylating nicotinate-nucleotide diphosphorylase [Gemmatimonadota bacterium]